MFTTLLESRAVRQRRPGGSLASIVIHSVIISGAVAATARQAVRPRPDELPVEIHFVPVSPPAPAPRVMQSASMAPAGPIVLERFTIPTTIPTTIPPIDLTAPATTSDFKAGPIGTASIVCQAGSCPAGRIMDGDRMLLSERDVAMQLREQAVPPRYPESLRRAGIEGDVMVKFVVDTTGMIDMRQVEILSSAHELFTNAVRESLARMRFSPSMVGERKVKALAIMPFRFRLR